MMWMIIALTAAQSLRWQWWQGWQCCQRALRIENSQFILLYNITDTITVGPSIGLSVCRLVTLLSKTREKIFWANSWQRKYTRLTRGIMSIFIRRSILPSVCQSIDQSVRLSWIPLQQVEARVRQNEYHIITSSYNHFIIIRTHRWPYGPCFKGSYKL